MKHYRFINYIIIDFTHIIMFWMYIGGYTVYWSGQERGKETREGGEGRRLVQEKDSVIALLCPQSQPGIT